MASTVSLVVAFSAFSECEMNLKLRVHFQIPDLNKFVLRWYSRRIWHKIACQVRRLAMLLFQHSFNYYPSETETRTHDYSKPN